MARTTKETSIPQPELGEHGHQRQCAARAEAGEKSTGTPGTKTSTRAESEIEYQL